MAKYKDTTTGEIIEVGSPELNPSLIAGKTKVDDTTPLGIINASTLSPSTPIDYKTTSTPSVPDVSKLDTSVLTLTPQEKKADDLSTQLQDIQNRLLGQSAFRAEKEKELDVEGLRKTQTDLSARLKAIQNEAQAIPLQLQEEAKGRGITVGGLAPEQTGRLRANAIQALSVSSLLEASRGNLTTALDMVDRAVAAKYDPIKEKNSVLLANLELILKSPSYTLADKNRAEVQKAKIAAQTKLDEKKELEEKEIGKIAVDAAKQGVDALTLKKIQEAKTSQEALSLAAPFMKEKEKPTFQTFERAGHNIRQVIDPMTGKVISEVDLGAKEKLTELTKSAEEALRGEFGDIIKSASNLVGAEKGKTSKASITQAIADNDFTSAYAQIANNVEDSLTGEVKTKFANSRIDYNVMTGMKKAIQDFSDAGGNMGYLKGTADEIARRFGQLTTDPKFAALAVQLQREFQTYRLNMTGAAFSPAESKEYAAVNPRTTASLNLNLATIDGALNQLENRITSTVNSKIPNAKKLYQKIGGDGMSDDDAYTEYLKLTGQSSGSR